jgi:molybdopterin/thiamine biosynthesis adenylyltransferase
MTITISPSAARFLRRRAEQGRRRGVEVHAYALGNTTVAGIHIEHFVSAGKPRASGAMIEPDYAAAAEAIVPYQKRGFDVLGEAHSHLDLIGPSAGDLRTLRDISPHYPGYLCLVIAPGPTITAHSIENDVVVEHAVVPQEYRLDTNAVRRMDVLQLGLGSGGAALTPLLFKLGFRSITVADNDVLEARNLERHLAAKQDVGKAKVDVLKRFARGRTTSRIRTIRHALTSETRPLFEKEFAKADSVINAMGHPVASRTASHIGHTTATPVIHAAVFEEASGGFVFLDLPDGACYSCLYPLNLAPEADDAQTLATLTEQYGFSEDDISAQLGLWTEINVIAALQAKVFLDFLKGKTTPNLYVIDNDHNTITQHNIPQREGCICKGGN